ncbi:MAG: NAD(P)H-dependent oxidoreductase subunit E [Thermoleophilaceae bacterium]
MSAQDRTDSGLPRRKSPLGWDEAADLEQPPAPIPEPAETDVPAALRERIETLMARYPDRRSATLPALDAAQRVHGWCSPEAIVQVASVMRVTPAYLSSVATFYDMLRTEPLGSRYVYVCTSVACHLRNAKAVHDAIADEAREQGLEDVDIREFECLGACDMAPMASVDGRYVGPLDTGDAKELVAALRENREVLPGRSLSDRGFELPWAERGEHPPAQPDGPPTPPETKAP